MQEQDEISRKNVSYGGQDWSAFPSKPNGQAAPRAKLAPNDWSAFPTSPTVVGSADSYAQSAAAIAPLLGITANSLD